MTEILSNNELMASGISLLNLKKSLTLTYQGKEFRRKSDIPKKFKEKALNIYHSIIQTGKKSLINEGPYSYTIWEEKPLQSLSSSSLQNSQVKENKKRVVKEPSQMKVYIRKADNADENKPSELEIKSEDLRKYRGVSMDKPNPNNNDMSNTLSTSVQNKTKSVRKYRGVIIQE